MKFRLIYEGELRATQREALPNQTDRLASHKHEIRRCFHKQLKHLWSVNDFLKSYRRSRDGDIGNRPIHNSGAWFDFDEKKKIPLSEYVAENFHQFGYRFVPLVCKEFSIACSLDILFLRRDSPGSALEAGDIDNRVKTIIDALRKPASNNELKDNEVPRADEDPFFCLLEDDKLVSHFAVETDILLKEPQLNEADKRMASVIVTVGISPYSPTHFNLAFS